MIHQRVEAHSVVFKVLITLVVGALSFPLTNVIFPSTPAQIAMSAGVGGFVLVVQFLIEFEKRLGEVEKAHHESRRAMENAINRAFSKIDDATRLFRELEDVGMQTDVVNQVVRSAAKIGPDPPELVSSFVQAEIGRMSHLLSGISEGEVTYEGEDRDWILGLTDCARKRIDATSLTTVDAAPGAADYDAGFWGTDLGQRYLHLQHEAIKRGVTVRRVVVLEDEDFARAPSFQRVCRTQAELGIEVRVLRPTEVPATLTSYMYDFILFDDVLSYETTPAVQLTKTAAAVIQHTRLVIQPRKVRERIDRYNELWKAAAPFLPD